MRLPGKRDFAPETKAPEHPHKSDCRFAETVCPRKTPPNRAYLREFSASATCRRCNLQSECLPETFFVSARRDYEPETRTSSADMPIAGHVPELRTVVLPACILLVFFALLTALVWRRDA
jgi:hypothetical protein